MARDPVLVTGPTGNTGSVLVEELRRRVAPVVLASRHPERLGDASVHLDLEDPSTYAGAVAGCRALFLLRPPQIARTRSTLVPLVQHARRAGVERIVFLSVVGATGNRLVPHEAVERELRAGPVDWTILQPGFFAQNLADAYRRDLVEDDRLYVPAGRGRVAFVDLRDVAVVAADALMGETDARGRTFVLTGPRADSFAEVAEVLTECLGRTVVYDPASVFGYLRHLRRRGLPLAQILVQTVLHVGLRSGRAEAVDPTLERLLGRRPRDVRDFVRDHAELWRPAT